MTDYERGVEQASSIYKSMIREYATENSRLRALLMNAYFEYVKPYAEQDDTREYVERMRELGIEVEK